MPPDACLGGVDRLAGPGQVEDLGLRVVRPALDPPAPTRPERHHVALAAAAHRREVAARDDPAARDDDDRAHHRVGARLPSARDPVAPAAHRELGQLRAAAAADRRERPAHVDRPAGRRQRLDRAGDVQVADAPAELAGPQAERRQIVPRMPVHRRERAADEEQPAGLCEREHPAVDPGGEAAEPARSGPHRCEVGAPYHAPGVVRELGEVAGDVEPAADPQQVVDAPGLLVARGPVGGGHLPAAHRVLRHVRTDRGGSGRDCVTGTDGRRCDGCGRGTAAETTT